jgi:hypothetical protein
MQAFWVIQPRRNNPIIQLEEAVLNRFFLSAEEAKEILNSLQTSEWHKIYYNLPEDVDYNNYEVVALVADWPPSQFDKKPEEDNKWQPISLDDLIEDLWAHVNEEGAGPEAEPETPPEPDWLPALRELSPLAAEWDQETVEALGILLLAIVLTTHEGNMALTVEIGGTMFTVAPGKSSESFGTVGITLKNKPENV